MRSMRGFTLAELLISMFILLLALSAIAAIAGPVLSAPRSGSSKSDTVLAAAYGLDILERDIRQSDTIGVFACSGTLTITCAQPTSTASPTPYIAVVTAYDSTGVFQPNGPGSNGPNWKAYIVYSQPAGSNIIFRTYEGFVGSPSQASAVTAVTAASTLPAGTLAAIPNAKSMAISVNAANNQVGLQLITAAGAGDNANETTYNTTILARN